MGNCNQDLKFYVVTRKVQPILSYPELKEMQLTIDCEEDCPTRRDGRKLLCQAIDVPKSEERVRGEGLHVRVTQTRGAKWGKSGAQR